VREAVKGSFRAVGEPNGEPPGAPWLPRRSDAASWPVQVADQASWHVSAPKLARRWATLSLRPSFDTPVDYGGTACTATPDSAVYRRCCVQEWKPRSKCLAAYLRTRAVATIRGASCVTADVAHGGGTTRWHLAFAHRAGFGFLTLRRRATA
jgi:hypothetical protein